MYYITEQQGLTPMVAAGAYWVRPRGVYWSEVQPIEGEEPNWAALSGLEQELQDAADRGMQVILKVQSSPDWAQAIPGVACGPVRQDHLDELGEFMFALVDRYKDQVSYWELWNEPDVDPDLIADKNGQYGCWGDESQEYYGGEYYAEMLKAVYPRIKAADPNAKVMVGGLLLDCDPERVCPQANAPRFLEGVLVNRGAAYFDGLSYHAYDYYYGGAGQYGNSNWNASWNTTGPVSTVKAGFVWSQLDKYNVTGKFLMNTEAALVCDEGCDEVFQNTKANYLAESYAEAFDAGLTANLWFSTLAVFRNTDLFDSNLNPFPAYFAYQFAQSEMAGAEYLGRLQQPGIQGYEFRKGNCPVLGQACRLWFVRSLDGLTHVIELPNIPYHIYDVYGAVLPADNKIIVTLEPLYVELPPGFSVRLPLLQDDNTPLINGDFEAGVNGQGEPFGWVTSSGGGQGLPQSLVHDNPNVPQLDQEIPSGNFSLLLGRANYPCSSNGVPLGSAQVEQTFTVPDAPDGIDVKLSFNYVIYTQDGHATSDKYDRFEVYINQGETGGLAYADGRPETDVSCQKWYRIPTTGWKTGSIDLVAPINYRGQNIRVSFQNWNRVDGWYNTFTYLDNIVIEVGNSPQLVVSEPRLDNVSIH